LLDTVGADASKATILTTGPRIPSVELAIQWDEQVASGLEWNESTEADLEWNENTEADIEI
jgi:hypothetical protein